MLVSSIGRAPDSQSGCHGFDSRTKPPCRLVTDPSRRCKRPDHEGPKEMSGRSIGGQCRPAWPASRRKLSVLQVRGAVSGRSTSGTLCSVWIPQFQTVRPTGGLARFAIASDVIAARSTKPTNLTSARLLKQHSVRPRVIDERLISRRFVSNPNVGRIKLCAAPAARSMNALMRECRNGAEPGPAY